jgi:hypothetical protein
LNKEAVEQIYEKERGKNNNKKQMSLQKSYFWYSVDSPQLGRAKIKKFHISFLLFK